MDHFRIAMPPSRIVPTQGEADQCRSSTVADSVAFWCQHRNPNGVGHLLDAQRYAEELGRAIWDFAIEIDTLREAGLSNSDLRWLVCKRLVHHGREVTLEGETGRSFRRFEGLSFYPNTCFVLTPSGVAFVQGVLENRGNPTGCPAIVDRPDGVDSRCLLIPHWDTDRQELRLGRQLVKRFKVPAANQELVLTAFEEEGWPTRIDDPLPPRVEQISKRRLHDTINSLNRNQKNRIIRFTGDGRGLGVRWEAITRPEKTGSV